MSANVHIAKNGRYYVRLPGGQTKFISEAEARKLMAVERPARRSRGATTSARVSVSGAPEIDFNERQVGTILRGFVDAARGTGSDPARLFGDAAEAPPRDQLLLELGREIFGHMPAAIAYFNVDAAEWARWYQRDAKLPAIQPAAMTPAAVLPPTAWLPPVIGKVTSRFGSVRDGARHEGLDVAVPVGTPVVAPVDVKVKDVGFGPKAGRFIVGDAVRDNGTFDGDGYRLTFAHLSDAQVKEGDVIQRGQALGLSGATGQVTGPHLHFKVEWVADGVFRDSRVAVDPLGLIPEPVLAGQVAPQPITGGAVPALTSDNKPLNVIVAPGAGRVSIGHGIIQPDTDVRVGSPDVQLQRFDDTDADPLEGIITAATKAFDVVTRPDVIRTIGGLTSAGATLLGVVQPETLPVTGPVAAGGTVVAVNAEPISEGIQAVTDPLEGIV